MTTVWEHDLTTCLDRDIFEWLKIMLEYIHHFDTICETDNQMEATRVKCNTEALFLELFVNF